MHLCARDPLFIDREKKAMPVGRRWLPGKSPNPGGVSKRRVTLVTEVRARLSAGDQVELACQRLFELATSPDDKTALLALSEFFDRLVGKAPQAITGAEGGPLVSVDLGSKSDEAIRTEITTLMGQLVNLGGLPK